jgi:hypothetical protein
LIALIPVFIFCLEFYRLSFFLKNRHFTQINVEDFTEKWTKKLENPFSQSFIDPGQILAQNLLLQACEEGVIVSPPAFSTNAGGLCCIGSLPDPGGCGVFPGQGECGGP